MLGVGHGFARDHLRFSKTASPLESSSSSDSSSSRVALEAQRKKDRALRRQRIRMLLDGDPSSNREQQVANPDLIATPQEMEFVCNLRARQLNTLASLTPERGTPGSGSAPRGAGRLPRSQSLGTGVSRPQWSSIDSSPCGTPPRRELTATQNARLSKSRSLRGDNYTLTPLQHTVAATETHLGSAAPQVTQAAEGGGRGGHLSRSYSLDPASCSGRADADATSVLRIHQQCLKSLSAGSPALNRCPVPRIPRSGTMERRRLTRKEPQC